MELDEYQKNNQANWNDRARVHVTSEMYGLANYIEEPERISDVVSFDAPLIGDIKGKSAVHLQCHIGTDTISLARLGAVDVAGLDFSETAVAEARKFSEACGAQVEYVAGNVYDAPELLGRQFDLVYTGVGAINWIADLDRWAAAVAGCLKPGGQFYIREMHPMAFVFEEVDGKILPTYNYFTGPNNPLTWDEAWTYTDGDASTITHTKQHEWNHSIAEVFNALTTHGMEVTRIEEHQSIEWQFVPSAVMEGNQWYLPTDLRQMMPLMFSMWATKKTHP